MVEVRVLRDNGETVVPGVTPDRGVVRSGQSDISNVDGPRLHIRYASHETRRDVLVEEELHGSGIETSLRSRSAANVRAAQMSSRSKSGKSARISASVIPEAKYSRISYTVIRSPRMHGFPPPLVRFQGDGIHASKYSQTGPRVKSPCPATVKHYRSLVPMAQEHRQPIFQLSVSGGAIGGHMSAVLDAARDFRQLAQRLPKRARLQNSES